MMDAFQTYHYKMAFALKVRSLFGTSFQDFLSTVLELANGSDFVRVRPFGSIGDKGCDGYLTSTGRVYQCFGKLQDAAVSVSTLVGKISDDFDLAREHLKPILKEWYFAHNLVDGLPTPAITRLEEMKVAYPEITFGFLGPTALEGIVLGLPAQDLMQLLGPAATAEDSRHLNLQEVRDSISAIVASIESGPVQSSVVKPVPTAKLSFNGLPGYWVGLIENGSKNAPHVQEYFEHHPIAETGDIVAKEFTRRYKALKLESLVPGDIMTALYVSVTGMGFVSPERQVAAYAILAYLFDACDIFEDQPQAKGVPA